MARLPQITGREEVPQDKAQFFDAIMESRGRMGLPYALLLHSPELAAVAEPMGKHVRYGSTLSPAIRELATITTSRELDCDYMWSAHTKQAREAGVSDETIETVGNRGILDLLSENDALTIRFGRELLHDKRVSGETWEAARSIFGTQGVTDLTAHFGWYAFVACVLNGFEMETPPHEELPKFSRSGEDEPS